MTLGQIFISGCASDALSADDKGLQFYLDRHARGDWGDCGKVARITNSNETARSVYRTCNGTRFEVITQGGETIVLLPSESIAEVKQ